MPVINATPYVVPNVMPNAMPAMGMAQPQYMGRMVTKKEFFKSQEMSKVAKNINASAIMMYIVAIITLFTNVIYTGNVFVLLDVAVVAGMGLGIQLAQSRVCSGCSCLFCFQLYHCNYYDRNTRRMADNSCICICSYSYI